LPRGYQCNVGFAEYAHRKYPEINEDIITMIEDLMEHPPERKGVDKNGRL